MRFSTKQIHAGVTPDPATGAILTPIYQTTTYVQESIDKYLEKRLLVFPFVQSDRSCTGTEAGGTGRWCRLHLFWDWHVGDTRDHVCFSECG